MDHRRLTRLLSLYSTLELKDLKRLEVLKREQRDAIERRSQALESLSSSDPVSLGACRLYQSCAISSDRSLSKLEAEIDAATKRLQQRRSQMNRFDRRRSEIERDRKSKGGEHD